MRGIPKEQFCLFVWASVWPLEALAAGPLEQGEEIVVAAAVALLLSTSGQGANGRAPKSHLGSMDSELHFSLANYVRWTAPAHQSPTRA